MHDESKLHQPFSAFWVPQQLISSLQLLHVSGLSSIDCNISVTFSRRSSVTPTEVRFPCVAVFLAFFVSSFPGSYVLSPPLCFHDFFFAHDDLSKKEISLRYKVNPRTLPAFPPIFLGFDR